MEFEVMGGRMDNLKPVKAKKSPCQGSKFRTHVKITKPHETKYIWEKKNKHIIQTDGILFLPNAGMVQPHNKDTPDRYNMVWDDLNYADLDKELAAAQDVSAPEKDTPPKAMVGKAVDHNPPVEGEKEKPKKT